MEVDDDDDPLGQASAGAGPSKALVASSSAIGADEMRRIAASHSAQMAELQKVNQELAAKIAALTKSGF